MRPIPAEERTDAEVADGERFTGYAPIGRATIVPKRAGIDESGKLDADLLGHEIERRLRLEARAPIHAAAQRVVGRRGQVARPDAGRCKAAHQVRPHLEVVERAQLLAAPRVDGAALQMQHADDVREDFVVIPDVRGFADEIDVAADAGKILVPFREEAGGRVLIVIERIVGELVADQRGDRRAVGQGDANRQRGFARVEITVVGRLHAQTAVRPRPLPS